MSTDTLDLLGTIRPDDTELAELVRAATGDAGAVPLDARAETVDYQFGTPSTAGLFGLRGSARRSDGSSTEWSVFVKRLQSVRYWEHLHLVPEPFREEFIANLPWWLEIAAHRSGIRALLPDGMRLPAAYRIDRTDDDRGTIWMEDIAETGTPWDLERFARAAGLLGRLAARRQPHLVEPLMPRPDVTTPGVGLRYYTNGRVLMNAMPAIADDGTWQHPLLRAAVCRAGDHLLRTDLMALGKRVPRGARRARPAASDVPAR